MTSRTERTALIVGAGIGGLATAVALRQAGWHVRVFEKATSPRELGFALLLAPNAMIALRALGLEDAVRSGGCVARLGEIRRGNGAVLRRLDAASVSSALGAPTVCVLRPVLHGVLLDALGNDAIELNSDVVSITADGSRVTLSVTDGRETAGDVLVGADGVGSTIRRLLHPHEPPPRASGLFALRGVASNAAQHLGDLSGVQYFAQGLEAGLGRASERAIYWYLSIPRDEVERIGRDPSVVASHLASRFDATFRAIVDATPSEDLRLDELFEREPLREWGIGPITLAGDAAHPMLPHAGQGAAQALEDAVALGRALEAATSITQALRDYERRRRARTETIVLLARRNARLGSVRHAIGCWLRDMMFKLVPESVVARSLIAVAREE